MIGSWLWKNTHLVSNFPLLSSNYSRLDSSTIIENIKATIQPQSEIGLAYLYFDTNDMSKQSSRSLLSSLVLTLTAKSKNYVLYEKNDQLWCTTPKHHLFRTAANLAAEKISDSGADLKPSGTALKSL